MSSLFVTFLSLVASVLAGVGAVVALLLGATTLWPILGAAGIGAAVAVPVTWAIARAMSNGR